MLGTEGLIQIRWKEEVFYSKGGEISLLAVRDDECPILGNIQGQVGWALDILL